MCWSSRDVPHSRKRPGWRDAGTVSFFARWTFHTAPEWPEWCLPKAHTARSREPGSVCAPPRGKRDLLGTRGYLRPPRWEMLLDYMGSRCQHKGRCTRGAGGPEAEPWADPVPLAVRAEDGPPARDALPLEAGKGRGLQRGRPGLLASCLWEALCLLGPLLSLWPSRTGRFCGTEADRVWHPLWSPCRPGLCPALLPAVRPGQPSSWAPCSRRPVLSRCLEARTQSPPHVWCRGPEGRQGEGSVTRGSAGSPACGLCEVGDRARASRRTWGLVDAPRGGGGGCGGLSSLSSLPDPDHTHRHLALSAAACGTQ